MTVHEDDFYAALYRWYAVAMTIAFGMLVPAIIGFGVDVWFNALPVATVCGTILGVVFGFFQLVKAGQRGQKSSAE